MTDRNIELTRRKILGAAGAIGVAGAGAGLGTSALFSDEESFANNSITAGTLDMVVEATVVATVDNDYWNTTVDLEGKGETADGPAVEAALDIGDAKPGDWLIICFEITNEDNPGYVQVRSANLVDNENGVTEPEADADGENNTQPGPDPGAGEGELAEKLLATIWESAADPPADTSSRSELEGLQFATNEADGDKPSHSWTANREEDGNVPGEDEIDYTNLRQAHNTFSDGVVIKNSNGTPMPVGTDEDVDGPAADFDPAVFYLLLEIPRAVGNEIQSDSVALDLVFESEQVRNNDDPFGPTKPTNGLTAYYPLENIEDGTADDASGNGNDGTVVGDIQSAAGQVGQAARLDGDDDYIDASAVVDDVTNRSYSVAAWVNTTADSRGEIASFNTSGGGNRILFFQEGGDIGVFETDNSTNITTPASINDGNWHHVAYTLEDGSDTLRIYVDGSEVLSVTTTRRIQSSDTLSIGQEFDKGATTTHFDGRIDEVCVYDRVLTEQEVERLANR